MSFQLIMYFVSAYFQGRVPAWNLAGLLQPETGSSGSSGLNSAGSSGSGLEAAGHGGIAHPLPHYSPAAYGSAAGTSHYPHLLPQSHPWSMPAPTDPTVPTVPSSVAAASTATSAETAALHHYKMEPEMAAASMYYPHHVSPNFQLTSGFVL